MKYDSSINTSCGCPQLWDVDAEIGAEKAQLLTPGSNNSSTTVHLVDAAAASAAQPHAAVTTC